MTRNPAPQNVMPIPSHNPRLLAPVLAALLTAAALPLRQAHADGDALSGVASGRLIMEDFRTRGMTDDGKTTWILFGKQAQLEGNVVHLQDAELTFRTEKDTVVITTPACTFDRTTRAGQSDAPLHVRNPQVTVDGVGYDILAGQQQLHIRSQVVMRIKTEKGILDRALPPAGGNSPAAEAPPAPVTAPPPPSPKGE